MATSENGWAVLPPGSDLLYTWSIPLSGGTLRLTLRQGSVGFLLCFLVMIFDARIEKVIGKVLDDWGYAYREVWGSTGWSNHASGTAIDLNALKHPLGAVGTLAKAALFRIILRLRFRGLLKWGGDYRNRKDEMHVEITPGVTMPQVEKRARDLMNTKRGQALLAANPTQRKVILS